MKERKKSSNSANKYLIWLPLLLLLIALQIILRASGQNQEPRQQALSTSTKHYEYIANDGSISVYDIDNDFILVKTISLPQTSDGVRGIVGHAGTHALYLSHGSDSSCCGSLLKLDLLTDKIVYDKKYDHGIDSPAVSPDGSKLYQPAGERVSNGT